MTELLLIIIFLYGLVLGSFFNVVGIRVPKNMSIVTPRSACPNCGRALTPLELIPVLSYLIQFGKCKNCKTKISPIYPLMEFINACLFVLAFFRIGWEGELLIAWTLISLLVIIVVSDMYYMLIPDKILLFFFILFFIERTLFPLSPWWDSLLGAGFAFLLLLSIAIISKGGMGGGDIKLFALLGFVLGLKVVFLAFIFSCFIGAMIGGIGLAFGKIKRKRPIPFGPFIAIGTLFAYFYYESIVNWYLSFFN